jgi:hypothetical protein
MFLINANYGYLPVLTKAFQKLLVAIWISLTVLYIADFIINSFRELSDMTLKTPTALEKSGKLVNGFIEVETKTV